MSHAKTIKTQNAIVELFLQAEPRIVFPETWLATMMAELKHTNETEEHPFFKPFGIVKAWARGPLVDLLYRWKRLAIIEATLMKELSWQEAEARKRNYLVNFCACIDTLEAMLQDQGEWESPHSSS